MPRCVNAFLGTVHPKYLRFAINFHTFMAFASAKPPVKALLCREFFGGRAVLTPHGH